MSDKDLVKAQYGRVKGASWFPLLYKKDIMVLGQGGIGSWTSLLLSRIGCDLHIFDMDRYEEHNMTGQLVKQSDIGKLKTEAMKNVIEEMSPDATVTTYGRYEETSPAGDIMICGFDNMVARKIAFQNWKHAGTNKDMFFQDGRLLAEQLQIFNIPGDRPDLIELYEKEYLFDDSEVAEAPCTFKQTSHCAAMIASKMVGFLTNWISGMKMSVPFKYEYLIPLNYTNNDNPTIPGQPSEQQVFEVQ